MIKRTDIEAFFDLEAEAAKKSWEALMKLPINERIRKRKAIKGVFLDKEFSGRTDDGFQLYRVTVGTNLSDFKEGECLILHEEDLIEGLNCRLERFDGDEAIILGIYNQDVPSPGILAQYYDKPLALDKNVVDLRNMVYDNFIFSLPTDSNKFWSEMILNKHYTPTFENIESCESKLDEILRSLGLNLLDNQRQAILKSMAAKDYYLIQGPPGTGKSFVLGIIILAEMIYLNHNVIIIGPNHMAINNAMQQVQKLCPTRTPLYTKVGQSYNAPTLKIKVKDEEYQIFNEPRLDIGWITRLNIKSHLNWLVGLTPHSLYTSRARGLECDTLVIDEAGQMTIPLALMGMIKAKKVIFAGDHKQLPPIVSSDKVSDDLKKSAFQTLISEDNCTMLDVSFRMCEQICNFVSDLFYDGKLYANKVGHGDMLICDNALYSFDTPVVIHNVEDDGEQTSDKEAEFITDTIDKLISKGVTASEIGVLAPFRAQAANVRRHIRKCKTIPDDVKNEITADTIDKMQGQEREVIIFSMVSGNLDYMTEMAEFLYSPNKLNVAFSRAKSKLIVVGNINRIKQLNMAEYPHIEKMLNTKHATML
jgi:hypothetical protein